jgi:hypothetical protein
MKRCMLIAALLGATGVQAGESARPRFLTRHPTSATLPSKKLSTCDEVEHER